jgi:hypothetical protein
VVVASVVVVSTAVVVSMGVSLVAVSAGEAFVAAVSTGVAFVVANSVQCEADTCSAAADLVRGVAFVAAVLVTAITTTDSIMMSSSSTTSAFRGGGAGAIRTDITVPTITRTVTIGTAGTVTKATPVMDTAMAADQGISEFAEAVTSALRRLGFGLLLVRFDTLTKLLRGIC